MSLVSPAHWWICSDFVADSILQCNVTAWRWLCQCLSDAVCDKYSIVSQVSQISGPEPPQAVYLSNSHDNSMSVASLRCSAVSLVLQNGLFRNSSLTLGEEIPLCYKIAWKQVMLNSLESDQNTGRVVGSSRDLQISGKHTTDHISWNTLYLHACTGMYRCK